MARVLHDTHQVFAAAIDVVGLVSYTADRTAE